MKYIYMKKIINFIESQEITIKEWIVGFIGIVFIRFLLESLSSPAPSGMMPTDPYTLVHYGLFFLSVALVLVFSIGFSTKDYKNASRFTLFLFPITWSAPTIDLLLNKGTRVMSYIYVSPGEILKTFVSFPFFNSVSGITLGMHIQIIFIYLIVGSYVWHKTNSIKKVITTIFISYLFMFCLGSIPSLLYALGGNPGDKTYIPYYIEQTILRSNILHNTLHEGPFSVSRFRFLQLGFDKLMSQILFIISIFLSIFIFIKIDKKKFTAVIKNSRPLRILYYLLPLFVAMFFGLYLQKEILNFWVDYMSLLCLLLGWYGMWMYSIHINDIYDLKIDKISNTKRPLQTDELNEKEMFDISYIHLFIALIGSWCAGFYMFFFVLVGIAAAYIYSTPPLRLRRVPLLSSFIIASVMLAATLSGFFFVSREKTIETFPIMFSLGILIFYTLQINFKDIKDIKGDRENGVYTMATIGDKYKTPLAAILFGLSFLIIPIFFGKTYLYYISVPAAIAGFKIASDKNYNEHFVFLLQFLFIICFVIETLYIG